MALFDSCLIESVEYSENTIIPVLYLLSFEAFNDSMYSTNMVSSDCSP